MPIRFLADINSVDKQILVVGSTNAGTADYGFVGDENTGMYRPSNHSVALTANGTAKLTASTGSVNINPTLNLSTVINAGTDTDKFLVLDSLGNVDFRTGSEVRSDIGAGTGDGTITTVASGAGLTGGATSGIATLAVDYAGSDNFILAAGAGSGTVLTSWHLPLSDASSNVDYYDVGDLPFTNNDGTVTSVGITAGTGISVSGSPITGSGSITVTNSSPDTGVPAILSDGSTPSLNTGITAAEVRSLIGAGTGSGTVTGSGTATRVAFWSSSSALSSDSNLYWNNTSKRLGVGTSAPANLLDVNGDFTLQGNQYMADNNKLILGSGSDLQIYHDGSNSYVRDIGTGDLYIDTQGSRVAIISDGFASTPMAFFYKDGAVELYHNNSKKIETTSAGATVTGDLIVTGGDLKLNGSTNVLSNASSASTLNVGDVEENDDVQTINIKTYGSTQMSFADSEINVNAGDTAFGNSSDIQLGQFTQIELNHTSTSGSGGNGFVIKAGSGSTTAGKVYYMSPFSTWNGVANTSSNSTRFLAVATGTSATAGMLLQGVFRLASHGFSIGNPLYLSSTSGNLTTTVPSASGAYVRVLGYAVDTDHIYFCPDNTWVERS